jgi:hypothetical protein
MKRIILLVVMGVLFLALYGFKLHLPTPNGSFEISTGLQVPKPKVAKPLAAEDVEESES